MKFTASLPGVLLLAVATLIHWPARAESLLVLNNGGTRMRIEVFRPWDSGNAYPIQQLSFPTSVVKNSYGLAADTSCVYVANSYGGSNIVSVFNVSDNGTNLAPVRTIYYDQNYGWRDIAVDSRFIYLSAYQRLYVFNLNDNGSVEPVRIIAGPATQLDEMRGLAVDDQYIYISTAYDPGVVLVFDKLAAGDTPPLRTITTANMRGIDALAVDRQFLYVLNDAGNTDSQSVLVFNKAADGAVAPVRRIQGPNCNFSSLNGLAVDDQYIFVLDHNNAALKAFALGADGNVAPHHTIVPEYPNQALSSPARIAIAPNPITNLAGARPFNDFDGDWKSDLAVYARLNGAWYVRSSLTGRMLEGCPFLLGGQDLMPISRDFDGDGKCDPAVFQAASGLWGILFSGSGYSLFVMPFNAAGCVATPADYDGDGKCDPALFQSDTGIWGFQLSAGGYALVTLQFCGGGYTPVPADYDGDGKVDPAVYQAQTGTLLAALSTGGYLPVPVGFSRTGQQAVPDADFDGDGKCDPAVYGAGQWELLLSAGSYAPLTLTFDAAGGTTLAADFDGDAKADPAVYNAATGDWVILPSTGGYNPVTLNFGGPGAEAVTP